MAYGGKASQKQAADKRRMITENTKQTEPRRFGNNRKEKEMNNSALRPVAH